MAGETNRQELRSGNDRRTLRGDHDALKDLCLTEVSERVAILPFWKIGFTNMMRQRNQTSRSGRDLARQVGDDPQRTRRHDYRTRRQAVGAKPMQRLRASAARSA